MRDDCTEAAPLPSLGERSPPHPSDDSTDQILKPRADPPPMPAPALRWRYHRFRLVSRGALLLALGGLLGWMARGFWIGPVHGPPRVEQVELVRVIDGDTITVGRGDTATSTTADIRLLRVDAPWRHGKGFFESRDWLRAALAEGPVLLIHPSPEDRYDELGRLLGYVQVKGRCLNLALVRAGWARADAKHGRGGGWAAFRQAEAEARAAGRGIWGRLPGRQGASP